MAYNEDVSAGHDTMSYECPEHISFFEDFEVPYSSSALGDITGLRVLDLGCGSGRLSRWLRTYKGAGEVIGMDSSEHMINQAREFENKEPLGIQYHVGDVSEPFEAAVGEGFDVVYGAFFLHYSSDKEMLKNMIVNIHRVLKKGGIFVTTNDDPGDDKSTGVEGIPNGKTRIFAREPAQEGDPATLTFYTGGRPIPNCQFQNYYWKQETYEKLFGEAGFKNFTCERALQFKPSRAVIRAVKN